VAVDRKIIKHWDKRAKKFRKQPKATGWGGYLRWIEKREVKQVIPEIGYILDVGCGNGYVLKQIISRDRFLVGLDISSEMVRIAKKRLGINAEIIRGDVNYLPFKNHCFDFAYSIRTLINIVNQEKQHNALKNLIGILKNNSFLLLIECCIDGLINLNKIRRRFNLNNLEVVWYNRFFKEKELESFFEENKVKLIKKMYFPIVSILEKV